MNRTRWPFVIFAASLFALLLGANLPTPLYAVYRQEFGFSNVVLTLIFATYAIVLVPSLLLFGQLSDRFGRRRVVALGLGAAVLASVVFLLARGTVWLFVARGVQGAALGATAGTAAAALVELEPAADAARAAVGAVMGQAGGAAVGPVLAGMLAEWAPAPTVLPYLAGLVITAGVGIAVLRAPEPSTPSGSWRLQWPSVPAGSRGRFAQAGLTGAAVWAVGALYLSVVPTYASQLLGTHNLALLGAITSCMLGVACVTQAFAVRSGLTPRGTQLAAHALLVAGLAALVAAFPAHALGLVLLAALLCGLGVGFGYFGSQADVNQLAPAERRGEVTAAFITCIYTGVAVASITVGLLSNVFSLFAAVTLTAVTIACTAVATAVWKLSSAS
ncbi:MFS transporter [Flindersiella endophytica]